MSDLLLSEYDLVALIDDQGRFVYASPSHETILGYAPGELHGLVGMTLVHPDDVASAAEQVEQQLGEAGARVVRVRTKSGAWVRLEGTIYSIGGDSALARHSILTLRNIDAREEARLARAAGAERERALSAQLEVVLRHAPVGIGLVDRQHRFVFVNEELAAINGVPVEEHAGRTLADLLPELAPELLPLYDRVLTTGEPIRGIAIEGETSARPGELRSWDASYHAVPGVDGTPGGVIAVVQETTGVRRGQLQRDRIERLLEASGDMIVIASPAGPLVYLNQTGRRLAGFGVDEDLAPYVFAEFLAPEEQERVANEILVELELRRRWEGTVAIRNSVTGETLSLDWTTFRFSDPAHGELIGAIGRDQRERRAAEARALESTQALETLFALSPVPILSVDLERRVVRANPATNSVFGWAEEELIGRQVPFEPEPTTDVEGIRREMREGRVASQRLALRRRDGKLIRVAAYASPQHDATGAHVGSIGFIFDVEELEQERERAEQVGRQQQAVAELSLYALGQVSVGAVLDRATALAAQRLDVEYAAVLELLPGEDELKLVSGVGWAEGRVGVATVDTRSGSLAGYTLELGAPVVVEDVAADQRLAGSPILEAHGVTSAATTVIREEGRAWGVLGALTAARRQFSDDDVNFLSSIANVIAATVRRERTTTQLRELTEELEGRVEERTREAEAAREEALRASIAKTDFLSRMSHELRTPLNAIVGFGQLLAMDERDPDTRESVDQILAAGLHLVGLIDELLDVAQIESGAIEIGLEPVRVGELAADVVGLVSPLTADKGIEVELSGAVDASVFADRRRLRQVLLNLLSNAIKYNRDDGRVEIVFAEGPTGVSISVRDTGRGIVEAEIARIFEPFHRVPGATRVEGTGLGLAVSRGLVEAMGGTIRVESTPGAGSVFTVELPSAPR